MKSNNDKLSFITLPAISEAQQVCIELLMSGHKQTEIAEQLDIAPATISRWRLDANFVSALRIARLARWHHTTARLDDIAEVALDSLTDLLNSDNEKSRVEALKIYFSVANLDKPQQAINVDKIALEIERKHEVTGLDTFKINF